MEQELYLARTMLNEDAYASRAWITCDVMGEAQTQGDRDLELYLELLMTLELKNKKHLIHTFVKAQVWALQGFLTTRFMDY